MVKIIANSTYRKRVHILTPVTFLVIDGNSLAHRAFHAIPLLSTSQGTVTNAVYGFATMLMKILADRKPQMVAVCFDKGKITFRHHQCDTYKATRKATPDELRPQFPLLKEMLGNMGIQVLEMDGYEADDLIGTMVTRGQGRASAGFPHDHGFTHQKGNFGFGRI